MDKVTITGCTVDLLTKKIQANLSASNNTAHVAIYVDMLPALENEAEDTRVRRTLLAFLTAASAAVAAI